MYSFDFMGATEQSRSGNDVLAMSPFTEKDDLDAVLTMIRGQQFVDTQNIFLMGQSQGGVRCEGHRQTKILERFTRRPQNF